MNSIQLTGRLTHDPERRETASEKTVVQMRLAVPRRKKDGKDQGAVFVNVVAYGGLAGSCADYLSKGRQVAVSGRLEYREWEGADGSPHSMHEVVADQVLFLGQPNGSGSAEPPEGEYGES